MGQAQVKKISLRSVRLNLEWVKKQILAQPERYAQDSFQSQPRPWMKPRNAPCKTIGCIAGWLDVRLNGIRAHEKHNFLEVIREAHRALGRVDKDGDVWLFHRFLEGQANRRVGTIPYAKAACRAIDKYMKEIGA